ncbi:MAG TPA: hypothetical protein VF493_22340 [Terriglobales bacterium]
MAYIEVRLPTGDIGIGSAFHIGDGIFVTARHVVEHNQLLQMRITEPVGISLEEFYRDLGASSEQIADAAEAYKRVSGRIPRFKHFLEPLHIASGPIYDTDPTVDLAIISVRDIHPKAGAVKLGWHYDDFIYRDVWQLNEAIVLGYPPIPFTAEPHLVAAKAQINAFATLRDCHFVHFILSCVPRGGFSGGLALHEEGFALGVITRALTAAGSAIESGYFAVLSIERIRTCLEANGILPSTQSTPPWSSPPTSVS